LASAAIGDVVITDDLSITSDIDYQTQTETFESFTLGDFNGQNGWETIGYTVGGVEDATVIAEVENDVNGTYVTSNFGGPVVGVSGYRLENDNEFIPEFKSTDTKSIIQFDVNINFWGTYVGLVSDVNEDGRTSILYDTAEQGIIFYAAGNSAVVPNAYIGLPSGNTIIPLSEIGTLSDNVSIRIEMDFSANGGTGAMSAFKRNNTNGEVEFSLMPSVINEAMNIDFTAADLFNPTNWTGQAFHIEGLGGRLDNVILSTDNSVVIDQSSCDATLEVDVSYTTQCATPVTVDVNLLNLNTITSTAELDLPLSSAVGLNTYSYQHPNQLSYLVSMLHLYWPAVTN